ncbi:MAG TPA: alpha/beta fold hydrolase [Thermoanaerobaculia bacterium]
MRKLTFAALLLIATASFADSITDVANAERSFAKAFADRDQAKFFSFVLDDSTFVSQMRTLRGKKEIVDRWSRFFASPQAPFSWAPERVTTNAAGTIGLSTGPVFDGDAHRVGDYSSVWVKQPDGSWKILFDGPGSNPPSLPVAADGDITTPDGAKLHFNKIGDGPFTVIVPLGFILFDDFKQLAAMATVIAYDPRNRGRSSHLDDVSSVTIQQDVKDLETVRAHFNVDKFVPVGFSYLGLMVAMYAIDHPDHVSRIVQLGPVPMKFETQYPRELTGDFSDIPAAKPAAAPRSQREACDAELTMMQQVLVGDPAHSPRVRSNCDLPNEWPDNLDRHFGHLMESLKSVNLSASDLAKLTMPVLTIHGTKDRNAPYGSGREWAMTLPNARLVTIPGAAHASFLDDPATVFAAIESFLRGDWPIGAGKVTALLPQRP